MKYLYLSILLCGLAVISFSCNKEDKKTHFTFYFFKNKTGSTIRISPSLISQNTEQYCDNCFISDTIPYQLATNVTTIGDTPPNETFDRINVYRNDSLKMVISDSLLLHFPWVRVESSETITDYTITLENL